MSARPESLLVASQWAKKAENDLRNAQHTLKLEKDCPFDTVCFHAQQCAEKYLKAALAFHGIDFPRTHDLTELAAILPPGKFLGLASQSLKELNPYAVEARYPGDWEPQTREEAETAVKIAKKARGAIRADLPRDILKKK